MAQIREDFVDPEVVWDPELFPPIPKIIGNLLGLVLVFGASAAVIAQSRAWVIVTLIGVLYFTAQLLPSVQRLGAYLRYEAWLVSPQSPPNHAVARVTGAVLIAIIAIEIALCCVAWFAQ